MGSCLSSGYHGKKKKGAQAASAVVSAPAISRKQDLRREDNVQALAPRSSSLGEDSRSSAVNVRQQQQPVVELDPAIWSQLPEDITRVILGKLECSAFGRTQCITKEWGSWTDDSGAPNEGNRHVYPLVIVMYTLILVTDLDDPEPQAEICERIMEPVRGSWNP